MIHVGPTEARELVDRLESEILDTGGATGPDADGTVGADLDARVPGSPEPPD